MKYLGFCLSVIVLMNANVAHAAEEAKKADAPKKEEAKKPGPPAFAVKVVVVEAKQQVVNEQIAVVGSLAANEAVDIKSEIDGEIKEIKFEEGQKVKKGDVLLVLDSAKLEANLNQAKATLSIGKTTYDRMNTLVESGAVSRQEFDQAKSVFDENQAQVQLLEAQLDDTIITAPFDGTIGERSISPGQVIAKNTLLTVLINDDPMKLELQAPERYLNKLSVGQKVDMKVAAFPEQTFEGEVYFIDPQVNDLTRTALVKAKVANPDSKLRRGMFAKILLTINSKPDALVVPETALISNGDNVMVFVVDAEKKANMSMVKTGIRFNGLVEITEGLKPGDRVITEGYQKIGPGSPVDPVSPDAPAK